MPWVPLDDGPEIDAFVRNFKRSSRFLIDEDVTAEFTSYLRGEGYNVTSVIEEGMAGASDDEVFQFARREKRILVTRNGRDFWNDRQYPIDQTHGIAILTSQDPRAAIYAIMLMGKWGELWGGCKAQFAASGEITFKSRNIETGAVTTKRFRFVNGRRPEEWVEA
jgi:predicted nuclease of predicted toxin-antitoxin system